jgi:capsular polysaccharide biosynthesis protein
MDPEILEYSGNLEAFFASTGREHHQHLIRLFNRYKRFREFKSAIAFPSLVVAADDIRIRNSIVTVRKKFLLSGASGTRMLVKAYQKSADNFELIADSFAEKRKQSNVNFPVADEDLRHLDFVLIAKNVFNYYHFTLETLPYLTLYKEYGLTGRVVINAPTKRQGAFVQDQIERFFPDISDRVVLQYGNLNLSRALLVLDSKFLYYQTSDECICGLENLAPESWLWRERELHIPSYRTLSMNSFSSPLIALRDQVLDQLHKASDTAKKMPPRRRLYVGRRENNRARPIQNELLLAEMLEKLGFETVYFEDYDVLTQAKIVSEAEVIVSVHGAGMTNMLYAQQGCLVLELSSLQIALLRLGDFNSFALVSRARYVHFFVDHDWEDQETVPKFSAHSIVGLKIDTNGISMLRSLILGHLEQGVVA